LDGFEMSEFANQSSRFTKAAFQLLVLAPLAIIVSVLFLAILFFMFLLGPIAIVAETYDLIRFDGKTDATLTSLEIVRGSKQATGVRVMYNFVVDENQIESNQLYPGFAGNNSTSTGGSLIAEGYVVGNKYTVYFDSSDPTSSCLEYGWHKWSIGWTAAIWGMVSFALLKARNSRYWVYALSMMLYGFGLLMAGSHTVRVDEVHWHFLALIAITAAMSLWRYLLASKEPSQESSVEKQSVS
jgi:hypothetical protein